MPWLITLALGWKWPSWAAKLFGWVVPILAVAAFVAVTLALIYHGGEKAGSAKVEAKVEKANTKSLQQVRADESHAQATANAIGASVERADAKTSELVKAKLSEIHNAIDATPPAAAGGPAPVFPADSVSASLNALIDSANGSAATADKEP